MMHRREVTQSVMSQCGRQHSEVTRVGEAKRSETFEDCAVPCCLGCRVLRRSSVKRKLSFRVLTMTQVPENPDVLEGKLGLRQAARRQTYQTQRL